jgi:hypothetical protein
VPSGGEDAASQAFLVADDGGRVAKRDLAQPGLGLRAACGCGVGEVGVFAGPVCAGRLSRVARRWASSAGGLIEYRDGLGRPSAGPLVSDGYAVLRKFVEADEISRLSRVTTEAARGADGRRLPASQQPLIPLRWDGGIVDRPLTSTTTPRSGALIWHQDWWYWNNLVS